MAGHGWSLAVRDKRFWERVEISGNCLVWTGAKQKDNYGHTSYQNKPISAHRLVALAFISNPENKRTVNHIDNNPSNNDITNLEWATYSEQELHSYKLGKVNSQAKLTPLQAKTIIKRLGNGESIMTLGKEYGVDFTLISQIKRGLLWNNTEAQLESQLKEVE